MDERGVTNWFWLGNGGRLNRQFLRCSAVYRCVKRYGCSKDWAVDRLRKVMPITEANALFESW